MGPNNTELQLAPQTLFLQHFLCGGRHVLTNQHSVSFLNVICPTGLHGGLLLVNIIRNWTQYVRWKDHCFKYWLFWWTSFWTLFWTLFWAHLHSNLLKEEIYFSKKKGDHFKILNENQRKMRLARHWLNLTEQDCMYIYIKRTPVVANKLVSEAFSGRMLASMKSHCKYSDLNFPTQNLWGHNFEANWGERCVNLRFICTS